MENKTHLNILERLRIKGPSLPIQLAKYLQMDSLFISAFLSELASEKKIKISHLKVGGSPLYFLEGQEEKLEPFHTYLPQKEIEAFHLIRLNKILKDSEQEPAIRVALRSIRDFAVGFKKDNEIFWRYILVPESEVEEMLEPKQIKPEIKSEPKPETTRQPKPEIKPKKPAKQKTIEEVKPKPEIIIEVPKIKPKPKKLVEETKEEIKEVFENPLIIPEEEPKKEKPKSEFVLKTIDLINQKFKILEEKSYKAKEYNCILQINSELGSMNFLASAKDKKTISETDLRKLLSDAQKIPLPAFLLYTGALTKKAREYLEKYSSILKAKKMSD